MTDDDVLKAAVELARLEVALRKIAIEHHILSEQRRVLDRQENELGEKYQTAQATLIRIALERFAPEAPVQ